MKFVIAPDAFKGSLSSIEAAEAMKKGVYRVFPLAEVVLKPIADGGEGTVETLVYATNGKIQHVTVTGPLNEQVDAFYGVLGDEETCVIEVASASGLHHVPDNQRNPLVTTSFGTGELIQHALNQGYRKFIIGLGGSATNDAGAGILQALGVRLLDENGQSIARGGAALREIATIDTSTIDARLRESEFIIASDVSNPFVGRNGASVMFGPQKGATKPAVEQLERALIHFANQVEHQLHYRLHEQKGAGAAGGIGGMMLAFFPSTMKSGFDVIAEVTQLPVAFLGATAVLTGEGKTDDQTLFGKVAYGVAKLAQQHQLATYIISGVVEEEINAQHFPGTVYLSSLLKNSMTVPYAIAHAATLLEEETTRLLSEFR